MRVPEPTLRLRCDRGEGLRLSDPLSFGKWDWGVIIPEDLPALTLEACFQSARLAPALVFLRPGERTGYGAGIWANASSSALMSVFGGFHSRLLLPPVSSQF